MLDFLPKKRTITGVYYANLLDQLRTAVCEKHRGKLSKGVLLQLDNARVHTCQIAMDAVERNGYELIPHPAYSPDLAPSDFLLFPNLKKNDIRGCHFPSDEEVVTAVEEWVNGKDPNFFQFWVDKRRGDIYLYFSVSALVFTGIATTGTFLFATASIPYFRGTDAMFPLMLVGRLLLGAGTGSSRSKFSILLSQL